MKHQNVIKPLLVVGIIAGILLAAYNSLSEKNPSETSRKTQSPATNTIFNCVPQGDGWATVAEKGNAVSKTPMITWNSPEFGNYWKPKQRCEHVSKKLTEAVANNGGNLSGLDLTHGKVGKYTVICMVNSQPLTCTKNNMLFTLSEKNAKTPRTTLAKITEFSKGKADFAPIEESGYPQYFPLKDWVEKHLPEEAGGW